MEPDIRDLVEIVSAEPALADCYPARWLAVKLLEGDQEARRLIEKDHSNPDKILMLVEDKRLAFEKAEGRTTAQHIAQRRYEAAEDIARFCINNKNRKERPFSDRIDGLVCHRLMGPLIMVGVIYLLYYLSIVQGYNLTNYTWPLLAKLRSLVETALPDPGFLEIPLIRAFVLWFMDSINALLNYVPIFFHTFRSDCHFGGQRLHAAHGFYHGSPPEQLRTARTIDPAHGSGRYLCWRLRRARG